MYGFGFYGYGSLVILAQIACIVHAVRAGKTTWIWIILFFPLIGCVIYVASEVRMGRRRGNASGLATKIARTIQPSRRLEALRAAVDDCPSIENRLALAAEHVAIGQYAEAVTVYRACLTGPHANDPHALVSYATALLATGAHADAKAALDRLPRNASTRLLYARALEGLGDDAATLAAYEEACTGAIGDEARARRAQFLDKLGRKDDALAIWQRIDKDAKRSDGNYRRDNREWISAARQRIDAQNPNQ